MLLNSDWRKLHPSTIVVKPDIETLAEYIADKFLSLAQKVLQESDHFCVILGGGRSPVLVNKKMKKKYPCLI